MATMNISLPQPLKAWVEQQAQGGRYSNSSDYVRDLIRRDRERTEGLGEVQALVSEGLESGEPVAFDKDAFLARMTRQHAAGA